MFSFLTLMLAAVSLAVLLWTLPAWLRTRSTLLLFNMLALAAVASHLLSAGLGRWLGIGQSLRDLYALPILLETFALPLTLFTFASVSRACEFAWAKIDWGHGLVCLIAVALLIYSLPDILTVKYVYPACWRDLIWYQRDAGHALRCGADGLVAAPPATRALVPSAVVLAYLSLGLGLWWVQRWVWLLALMLPGAVLLCLPAAGGPMPQFVGEALCFCGIALVARRHALRIAAMPASENFVM